jgi:hypothetical protein
MAINIKQLNLYRCERPNRAGALAEVLGPLAQAGCDLQLVMGYRLPEDRHRAAIEVFPLKGSKALAAADAAGLQTAAMPCLRVTGDNRPGMGAAIAERLADTGINMNFLVTQVMGKKFNCVIGFDSTGDANAAAGHIRAAVKAMGPARRKKAPVRRKKATTKRKPVAGRRTKAAKRKTKRR